MPKILIMQSAKQKTARKCETSLQNMKALIEKRLEKDATDVDYVILTLNTRMTLPIVRDLMNKPFSALCALEEGVVSVESLVVHPEKKKGRWELAAVAVEKKAKKKLLKKKAG